eukprot:COSAG06_NODE_2658_length_6481_cov_157.286901_7_plen_746_part_01
MPSGECGIFFRPPAGAPRSLPWSLPLVGSSVATTCHDLYAETKVRQVYHNDSGNDIEKAVYSFPLHNRAAVNAFEVEIDAVITHGRVLEKKQAVREFNDATAAGGSAQLLEQESRDVFQMSIGGLKAAQTVTVRLTHVSVLRIVGDAVEVFIPTYVAPRYKSSPVAGAEAASLTELTLKVECHMASDILAITSETHPITTVLGTEDGKQYGTFKLTAGTMQLDKDFVAMITTVQPHQPRVILETSSLDGSTTAAVTVAPRLEFADCRAEFVFVVDRSGSMRGPGIAQARSALTLFLRSLPHDCYFNIVGFGSRFKTLFPASVKLDSATLATATSHVHGMEANLGGTEILQPILFALGAEVIEGYSRQVFVLTDGRVGNTDEVIAAVGRSSACYRSSARVPPLQRPRCFALGFGHGASRGLVEGIAKAGRGSSDFVIGDELDRAVVSQLKRAMQPSLTETQLEWGLAPTASVRAAGAGADDWLMVSDKKKEESAGGGSLLSYTSPMVTATRTRPESLQAPQMVPQIFSGERFAVFVLDADPNIEDVVITSNTPDGPLSVKLPVSARCTGSVMQTLAGREAIADLEHGTSWLTRDGRTPGPDEARSEIVKLGTALGLVSKYTSYLVTQPPTIAVEAAEATAQRGKDKNMRRSKGKLQAESKASVSMTQKAEQARPQRFKQQMEEQRLDRQLEIKSQEDKATVEADVAGGSGGGSNLASHDSDSDDDFDLVLKKKKKKKKAKKAVEADV